MAYPPSSDETGSTFINGAEIFSIPFGEAIRGYDELIEELEASLREAQEKREAVISLRDESHSLFAALRTTQQRAHELGLVRSSPGSAAHLRAVPEEEEHSPTTDTQASSTDRADDLASTSAEPAAPSPSPDGTVPDVVVVRGARMKEILSVVGSRPDEEWTSSDVAELLGVSRSDRSGRRALRANLHALTERGALERITVEGDSRAYYKGRMNWRYV
jgi:hypothetical protein